MHSTDALLKDWLELVLSKPTIQNELLSQNQKLEFTRPELYKLKLELETRSKEVEALQEQLVSAEGELSHWRETCTKIRNRVDAGQRSGAHSLEERRKKEASVLKDVSRRSIELSDMMCARCDTEMDRTRRTDDLLIREEGCLSVQLKELGEVSANLLETQKMREAYDSQLVDDFNVIIELMLTVESLEKELGTEKRYQSRSDKKSLPPKSKPPKHPPLSDAAAEMKDRVSDLSGQLQAIDQFYAKEFESLQNQLTRTKLNKRSGKTKFQSDIKSLFTDFDFLRERLARAENGLEKVNLHYTLDEEELINIVAPLVENIDAIRAQINFLEQQVDGYFYGGEEGEDTINDR